MKISTPAGIALAIAGGAIGQLCMKSGMQGLHIYSPTALLRSASAAPEYAIMVLLGIASYIFAMLIWIQTLRKCQLSVAYPILSLGYVLVYFAAAWWPGLDEALSLQKTLGIALIIFGVWFSHTSSEASQ